RSGNKLGLLAQKCLSIRRNFSRCWRAAAPILCLSFSFGKGVFDRLDLPRQANRDDRAGARRFQQFIDKGLGLGQCILLGHDPLTESDSRICQNRSAYPPFPAAYMNLRVLASIWATLSQKVLIWDW